MIMQEKFHKNLEQKGSLNPSPAPPPPPPKKKKKKKQIWTRELKIKVEEFVLKTLLTYFEILIVPHALQCVDGCFFFVF